MLSILPEHKRTFPSEIPPRRLRQQPTGATLGKVWDMHAWVVGHLAGAFEAEAQAGLQGAERGAVDGHGGVPQGQGGGIVEIVA